MTEQLELKTIPLPDDIKTLLTGYPEELSLTLQQEFSPNYECFYPEGITINHYHDDEGKYILLETSDTLYEIVIIPTEDGKEVRELTIIQNRERNPLFQFLFDLSNNSIKLLSDQIPNVEQL